MKSTKEVTRVDLVEKFSSLKDNDKSYWAWIESELLCRIAQDNLMDIVNLEVKTLKNQEEEQI